MRISKIEKIDDVYFVTTTPADFFERIFVSKEKIDRYKWEGKYFEHMPHIKAFRHESGMLMLWHDPVTLALNRFGDPF